MRERPRFTLALPMGGHAIIHFHKVWSFKTLEKACAFGDEVVGGRGFNSLIVPEPRCFLETETDKMYWLALAP